MSEIKKDSLDFVGYEYKQMITNADKVSFLIDGYKNFGWVVDENVSSVIAVPSRPYANIILQLKRDRKIVNKMELTRLQRNFEFCLKEMEHLERSKTSKAMIYAIATGLAGTAFMAGSVFAVTASPPRIAICIILALPAFAGWTLPNFLYKHLVNKRTEEVNLLIEKKQEEVFEICEKGSRLLH